MKTIAIIICIVLFSLLASIISYFTDTVFPQESPFTIATFIWCCISVYVIISCLFHLKTFYNWFISNLKQ